MECNLLHKDYNNALFTYLVYSNISMININYTPPIEIKKYFNEVFLENLPSFTKIKIVLSNSEGQKEQKFKS